MKIKVLLVEDNEMILKGLTYTLETEGFEVLTAKNYREAQGKIFGVDGNADFDIAVLDVTLPDGDGFRLCTEIKEDIGTPVIFLTAKDDKDSVMKVVSLKPEKYLLKSMPKEKLISAIDDFFITYANRKR